MMRYSTHSVYELSAEHWAIWSNILEEQPSLDVPFLRPEFTQLVGGVRSDVEVAVIEQNREPVGFFPFQRNGRQAHAVVGRLSECHGAIVREGIDWDGAEMFRACGLRSWHFDHLPSTQVEFSRFSWGTKPSPYLDLSEGYETYRERLKASGSSLSQAERKTRKLEREQGTLRFEWHTEEDSVLEQLIAWKSAQHRRTGVLEIFEHDWVCQLLKNARATQTGQFSAPLSALYAGDRLIAAHLGLCTRSNLHLWFPAYDSEFHRYSPGLIMLLMMAQAASERGITRFELGPGEEPYKQQFKSADHMIHEGIAGPQGLTSTCRSVWYHTKRSIRSSRYRNYLEVPLNTTRRFRQWIAFR